MSSSSANKVSGSRAGQPKHKTPPKAYVRQHDDDDDSSDDDGETPSEDEQQNPGYRSDSSTEKADSGGDGAATNNAKKKKRLYEYSLATTPRRQQQVERTDDFNDPNSTQQTVNRESPQALWKTIDESMKQVKVEKTAVHDFVANYLFPKLKFVRGTSVVNMDYSTDTKSLCALVMSGCHQEHSAEGMIWWAIARKQTIQEIKRLRNDASKNLKSAFLGKSTKPYVVRIPMHSTHLCLTQ